MEQAPTLQLRPSDATNLAGTAPEREHLSHSSISTLLNCPQRYEFEKVKHLAPVATPKPLTLGKAFQLSIEHADPEHGVNAMRAELAPLIVSQYGFDDLMIDETIVRAASTLYLSRFGAPAEEVREMEYRVQLRNPWTGHYSRTFDLLGFADGVIDRGAYLELTENKLLGQIDAKKIRRLKLDRQISLASYGLWRATGKPVRVIHYRITRKPSIKPKKGESVEQFCDRLAADYADPERRDFYSHSEDLFRSEDDLLASEAELWEWAERLRHSRRRGFWTRNTSQCFEMGGCPFIPLCSGDQDAGHLYREKTAA